MGKNLKNTWRRKKSDNNKLMIKYEVDIFRRLKWYGYINRKSDDNHNINKFEEHCVIMGDLKIPKQMRNFISAPNVRLRVY